MSKYVCSSHQGNQVLNAEVYSVDPTQYRNDGEPLPGYRPDVLPDEDQFTVDRSFRNSRYLSIDLEFGRQLVQGTGQTGLPAETFDHHVDSHHDRPGIEKNSTRQADRRSGFLPWPLPALGRHTAATGNEPMAPMQKRSASQMQIEFGQRLTACREARGFNVQAAFARKLGVDPKRYNTWEQGKAAPSSIDLLFQLCELLGVTADYLLFGDARGLSSQAYQTFVAKRRPGPSNGSA